MRFCNFIPKEKSSRPLPYPGIQLEERIYRLDQILTVAPGLNNELNGQPIPLGYIQSGGVSNLKFFSTWLDSLERVGRKRWQQADSYTPDEVSFAPAIYQPISFRDFYAFEEHVRNARARRNLDVPQHWYEEPVFYFSNAKNLVAHSADLAFPKGGNALDFELEIGAVITSEGKDIALDQAENIIGAYTIVNDWSLRDVQMREVQMGLGPAKGKDFALGIGPWLVTPDELQSKRSGKGFDIETKITRNGKTFSTGNWKDIHFSFGEMISRASRNVTLQPGELLGSGTVGKGCILEFEPESVGGWLQAGDVVSLEIENLGTLENKIVTNNNESGEQ